MTIQDARAALPAPVVGGADAPVAPVARTGVVLSVRGLTVEFAGSGEPAVAALDLDVAPGEILALVGESRAGKTVAARAVLGLLPRTARVSGRVELGGRDVAGLGEAERRRLRGRVAAMIPQEPSAVLSPGQTVGRQLRDALRAWDGSRRSRADARRRAVELLRLVGLDEPEQRLRHHPHQLSGGQRQRVVIALALASEPALLVADEPTTALDAAAQAEILRDVRDRRGTAVLLITQHLGVVADLADRVVVLRDGHAVESAPVDDLLTTPAAPHTRELIATVPRLTTGAQPENRPAREGVGPVLALTDVVVRYSTRSAAPAVDGVSLDLRPGEVLGIVGESGSGKSTIGRVAAGLLRPESGLVELFGSSLGRLPRHELEALRRDVGVVAQDPATSLDPRLSVAENIAEPLRFNGVGDVAAQVRELLEQVRLPAALGGRRPAELSCGERRRVALARALALRPRLLVADEPIGALDLPVPASAPELFRDLQAELGFAALFISHDLAVVDGVCDRVLVLRRGREVETGPASAVLHAPEAACTRALLDAVPDPFRRRSRRARA